MSWIYLSKNGTDEYIGRMAQGAGVAVTPIESWLYEDHLDQGLVLRGIMKHKIIKKCWEDSRPFRFMDTGYLGCRPNAKNPQGWKIWHRIVENDIQHGAIIPRPDDRWRRLGLTFSPWTNQGSSIVVVAPDDKPCRFYGMQQSQWLNDVLSTIKKYTDRPIMVRQRTADPDARTRDSETSFAHLLTQDIWAVVTFNSNAAVESLMEGIPTFVLAPCHAALPVSNTDLALIENPWRPDGDLIHQWLCHLSYGQFHNSELEDGTALRILDQTREMMH